ncbi:pyridoxal phosphate-dependent decarboxylase family protein [Streptomyces sp. NPDC094448]|uniref:pyridoxal phosphate-dependent decarboxylase family protein n=1 Tax=Streptomyces sp. NPDC094448 TaxID=3366063 RepID=UPI0037F2AB52
MSHQFDALLSASAPAPPPGRDGLDVSTAELDRMLDHARQLVCDFHDGIDGSPAQHGGPDAGLLARLSAAPAEEPGDVRRLMALAALAAKTSVETSSPRFLGYVPSGGLATSAVASLLTAGFNRYSGLPDHSPALVALEHGVMRWLCQEFGLPATAVATTHTGTSMATLTAIAAARHTRLGEDATGATVYTTRHTHPVALRALRIAGLPQSCLRIAPTTGDLRMDPRATARMIEDDRRSGYRPFLLMANAGTTTTGTIDPLDRLADLARREALWLHVDAAYGGAFQLTERGRERLAGIGAADSITLDPHKGFFLPNGLGVLLVRDAAVLRDTFALRHRHCLADQCDSGVLPSYSDLGPELTREYRGLRLWLPLHVHGVGAFRRALDRMLDLAVFAQERLTAAPALETMGAPPLTVVPFRLRRGGDPANRALVAEINSTRSVFVSGAEIDGRYTGRICLLNQRLTTGHLEEALHAITGAAEGADRSAHRQPAAG